MPQPEDPQPTIEALKAANVALTAKVQDLQARITLNDQQFADLKAAVENLTALGK